MKFWLDKIRLFQADDDFHIKKTETVFFVHHYVRNERQRNSKVFAWNMKYKWAWTDQTE
jgi:hypothetical protein